METAFGHALIDSLSDEPTFITVSELDAQGRPTLSYPYTCHFFTRLQLAEQYLLDAICGHKMPGRILNLGCGLGQHLRYILETHNRAALCHGIEPCDLLRQHLQISLPGTGHYLVPSLADLPESRYDLILCLGTMPHVFTTQRQSRKLLQHLVQFRLNTGGRLLITTQDFRRKRFEVLNLTIAYEEHKDGPFSWGLAGEKWLDLQMEELKMTKTGYCNSAGDEGTYITTWTGRPTGEKFIALIA